MQKKEHYFKVVAIYTENGFTVDKFTSGEELQNQDKLYEDMKGDPWKTLYESAFLEKSGYDISLQYLQTIAKFVVSNITKNPETNDTRTAPNPDDEALLNLLRSVPYVLGCEFVSLHWIKGIYEGISKVFNEEFAVFSGNAEDYFKTKNSKLYVAGKVYFHLVEARDEEYPFAFLATYSEVSNGNVRHVPLKKALEQNKGQEEILGLLSAVNRVADKSEFISELIETGEVFSPLKFTAEEAYAFLKETPICEECGVFCRIPNFWRKKNNARLSVSVGNKEPSAVGLQALMAFSPEIYLGDEKFTKKEIEELLSETSGLAFLKGKWVELDRDKLQSVLSAFEKLDGQSVSLAEAIRMQSGLMSPELSEEKAEIEITNGQWLSVLKENMLHPSAMEQKMPEATFRATLRHYQSEGFSWLNFMVHSQFGALLADDMGLGKTVQILALLDSLRKNNIKTLLIIPASLIENWRKEAEKFAPELRIKVVHGVEKDFTTDEADLFITTYGMVARLERFAEITWDLLVLDEAQAIKNHANKQTKAVKTLSAKSKIAMTGTPVENRLSDLWSIFDFLNRGLLGTPKEFGDFTKALKDNSDGYANLRGAVSPFILRRLKTDKSIINDLPDKIETLQFATLTKKQVVLYNQLVKDLEHAMSDETFTGINRKGLILASIMKFKQICNHPDQYIGSGDFEPKNSGKFELLEELCRTISEKRERVLVFTQFKEMTKPLADFMETIFERKGLILHGGTSVMRRGELVDQFNGEEYVPFMVLSLKAGGVGLNLTSANHVIHFDRWWNPAIENQATDRAFRIGQQKNVNVYKFVTTGTIEEKIDTIIEGKQKLAGDVISATSGEKWLTEMGNDELFKLFKLGV